MPFLIRCPVCQQYYVIPRTVACTQAACMCGRPDVIPDRQAGCPANRLAEPKPKAIPAVDESVLSDPTEARAFAESRSDGIPNLVHGTINSLIGSCSVAALWVGAALAVQMEIGWMAWGLGALSGFGMGCGREDNNSLLSGIIAAKVALIGILAAKLAIFLAVVLPIMRQIDPDLVATTPSLFFSAMFDPVDGVFIFLGIAAAYKLGSSESGDE